MNSDQRMNTATESTKNSTSLYDAGGGYLVFFLFGIPVVGSIADGIWNYIVLTLTLWPLKKRVEVEKSVETKVGSQQWFLERKSEITTGDRIVYTFIITVAGVIIDAVYFFMVWNPFKEGDDGSWWEARVDIGLQIALILLPITFLASVNYFLASRFLEINHKHSIIMASSMAFFTAPWLLLIIPIIS